MQGSGDGGGTPASTGGRGGIWLLVVLFTIVAGVVLTVRVENGWLLAVAIPMVAFTLAVTVRVVAVMRGQKKRGERGEEDVQRD